MNLNFENDGVNFNDKGKIEEIATPLHICKDMSNLFDYTNCNQKIWIDIFCKTGNTLEALKEHSVNKNNIVAICNNKQSQMLVCRKLYGKLLPEIEVEIKVKSLEAYKVTRRGQVYWVSNWKDTVKDNYQNAYDIIKIVILKEMENTMSLEFTQRDEFQINNIIMNPPYNPSDLHLDFVRLAKQVAVNNTVAIVPAKCIHGKSDKKNDKFREDIAPYISDVVFYRNTPDIFDINEMAGICYFKLSNNINTKVNYKATCNNNEIFNTDWEEHDELVPLLPNKVQSLINKIKKHGSIINRCVELTRNYYIGDTVHGRKSDKNDMRPDEIEMMASSGKIEYVPKSKVRKHDNITKYKVVTNVMPGVAAAQFADQHKTLGMNTMHIVEPGVIFKGSYMAIYFCDTLAEAESFVSFMETNIARFCHFCGVQATTVNLQNWRFVPDPGAFDHIFTDEELYEKYDLTEEEIAIIKSVIKERK